MDMLDIIEYMDNDIYDIYTNDEEGKLLNQMLQTITQIGITKFLKKYEEKILSLKNPALSYILMNKEGSRKKEHRKIILESNNGKYNFLLCEQFFLKHPIKSSQHKKAFIKSGDGKYNFWAYKYSFNDKKYAKAIINGKDPKANMLLFKDLINSDKKIIDFEKNRQVILESKCPEYNTEYARIMIFTKDDKRLQKLFRFKNYNFDDVFKLIKQHGDIVLKSKNLNCCSMFLNILESNLGKNNEKYKSYINKFGQVILESKDARECYYYVYNSGSNNIKEFEDVVLESKNLEYCYKYAKKIKGANIRKFARVIIDSENEDMIIKFFENVDGATELLLEDEFSRYSYLYTKREDEFKDNNRISELLNKKDLNRLKKEFLFQYKDNLKKLNQNDDDELEKKKKEDEESCKKFELVLDKIK